MQDFFYSNALLTVLTDINVEHVSCKQSDTDSAQSNWDFKCLTQGHTGSTLYSFTVKFSQFVLRLKTVTFHLVPSEKF